MKAPRAYLTIDDSPSLRMDDLVDYLEGANIPALLFCRGDRLEENSAAAIRAIQKGFTLGNHAWSHQRSSQKEFAFTVEEIERTEQLLEKLHAMAGVQQKGRYFRFPHIDRGTGGWIVDYKAYNAQDREGLTAAFSEGLNVSLQEPSVADIEKKRRLQSYLKAAGYTQPFKDVTQDWFAEGEVAQACDCLYTFSNCDWMVTARHAGNWPYKTLDDLKQKAKDDPYLCHDGQVSVILAHDQAEIVDVTISLIEDLKQNGLEFLEV